MVTGMTLNFCLMKNCPTFSYVPSSRGETYLTVPWFIMTALSSHFHAKISAMKQLQCMALRTPEVVTAIQVKLCLVRFAYFSVNLF